MQSQKTSTFYLVIKSAALTYSDASLSIVEQLTSDNAKDIHQLRVNCKRLRAYWRAIRPLLSSAQIYTMHNNSLRNTARLLSQSREAHVNRKLIQNFMAQHHDTLMYSVFEKVLQALPLPKHQKVLPLSRLRECFLQEQLFWNKFSIHDVKPDVATTIGMIKTFGKAKKLAKRTVESDFEAALAHEWRKWSKYLYYQLQLFSTKPKRLINKKVLLDINTLNDDLGKLHDLFVLEDLIAQTQEQQQIEGAAGALMLIANSRHQLARQLKKFQKKVYQKSFNELVS